MVLSGLFCDWQVFGGIAAQVTGAYLLALPVGWKREQVQHSVGLWTFQIPADTFALHLRLPLRERGAARPEAPK